MVAAVVVLYHPDQLLLGRLLKSIYEEVDAVFAVDNTPGSSTERPPFIGEDFGPDSYIPLGDNMGIAAAQNVGIRKCLSEGYSHVLLLDQDSCPDPNMVHELLAAEAAMLKSNLNVAAVGPLFIDEKNGTASKAIRHGWLHVRKIPIDKSAAHPVEADYLISSGSLIRLSKIKELGLMREELFIDWVDIEWGLRALRANSKCYIVPSAVMRHSIGDDFVRVLAKDINLHNDIRNYYIVRNATYLLHLKSMGWRWRSVTFVKIPLYVCFYSWHSGHRWQSMCLLCKAVSHGLRRRVGRLD